MCEPYLVITSWPDLDGARQQASPHLSPAFVARRRKAVPCMTFATEECADIVDTMLSALTELKLCRVQYSAVAVEGW
jgi:hypothetical protein